MMPSHLKVPEEIEREDIPGLVEVLREEGLDGVRYALWDVTGWHRDYGPSAWRNRGARRAEAQGLGEGGEDREDTLYSPG